MLTRHRAAVGAASPLGRACPATQATQLTSLLLRAERDEARLKLGSAVAEARQFRIAKADFATAAQDRLSAAIERFSRAEEAYKADACREEELSSQASLMSYEASEADCELTAAKALMAELLEEARREEERRQAERAAWREKQKKANAQCECNRGWEVRPRYCPQCVHWRSLARSLVAPPQVNHSLGYHVCRFYGDFLCCCGNRWSSGAATCGEMASRCQPWPTAPTRTHTPTRPPTYPHPRRTVA